MTSFTWYSVMVALVGVVLLGPVSLLSSMNTCNGHGYTQWWKSDCVCTGPYTGRNCDICTCANGGTCSASVSSGQECVCDPGQQWSGPTCETCLGFCTRYDLDYLTNATTNFSQLPCIGKCLLPCNKNIDMYENEDVSKCQKCTRNLTCSGHGACKTSGGTTDSMCECDPQYWSDPKSASGTAECASRCGGTLGCSEGSSCDRTANPGSCLPVFNDDGTPYSVGFSARVRCPPCVPGRGECQLDSHNSQTARCVCLPGSGFTGQACENQCPKVPNTDIVCGRGDAVCGPDGRCVCDGTKMEASETCDCLCSENGKCVIEKGKYVCKCKSTGSFNPDCSACDFGFTGPNCDIRCDETTCSMLGTCTPSMPGFVPTCHCFRSYPNADPTIRNIVLQTETERTTPVKAELTYRDPPASTHIAFENTLVLVPGGVLQKYTFMKYDCGLSDPCVVNPFDGSAVSEIDGTVPLSLVTGVDGACHVVASPSSNLLQACIEDETRKCIAFSETAGMLFSQVHGCKTKDAQEDTASLEVACTDDPSLRACQYQAFSLHDHSVDASGINPFIALPTPRPPTPFPTPAVVPGQVTIRVMLELTGLSLRDQIAQCNSACRSMSNATADVVSSGTEPVSITQNTVVYTQCTCTATLSTASPTAAPTPAPTPSPTRAPSPTPSVLVALGFTQDPSALSSGPGQPALRASVPLQDALDSLAPGALRPAQIVYNGKTSVASLQISLVDGLSADDAVAQVQAQLSKRNVPSTAELDATGRFVLLPGFLAQPFPLDAFFLARHRTKTPKISNSTGLYYVITQERVAGCGQCLPNFYPTTTQTADATNVAFCSKKCIASETCHGRGSCNSIGNCDCLSDNGEHYSDDTCTTCRMHFWPKPTHADKSATKQYKIGWCSSYCRDDFTEKQAATVLLNYTKAWVIGCSGHGFCENGQTNPDSTEPNVKCACAAGYGGRFCASSCHRTEADQVSDTQCSGHGTCLSVSDDGHKCECDAGFFGPFCEIGCTGMAENQVTYVDGTVDTCNARDATRGGVCSLSDSYRVPIGRGTQVHNQQCWLSGPVENGELVADAAAAAECCGLDEDTKNSSVEYLSTCTEAMRLQMGIFCDTDSVLERGTCRRASCDCVGRLGGTNCFLSGCPQVVVGAKFSHCGEKNGVGECARGYCVPQDAAAALKPVNATPGTASAPGLCACQRQPSTTGACANTDAPGYTQDCCNDASMNQFHGPGCSKACGCSNPIKGTCANSRDATGVCTCRRTFPENRALFCGPTCSGMCPGVHGSSALLQGMCPHAQLNDTASSPGCYDNATAIERSVGAACSGHGTCSEQNCRCACDGTDTNVVAGSLYPEAYLYQGVACQFKCPGTTDLESLDAILQQVDAPNSATTVEVARALERYAEAYAEKACSGHGYCAQDQSATAGHCTCHGGYTGADCSLRGCSSDSSTAKMLEAGVDELDQFGLQTCSGHGTCAPPSETCSCDDSWVSEPGGIYASLSASLKAELEPYRHALTQECGLCAQGQFTASASASSTAVANENVPPDIMYLLGRRNCGSQVPAGGPESFPMCCADGGFQNDVQAMLVGGGCQRRSCKTFAAQGKQCETCLFGFQDATGASACGQRCAVCGNPLGLHHLDLAAFERTGLQLGSAVTVAMRSLGCRACADGGMAPEIRHGEQTAVCSGRGQCAGAPTSWAAGAGDAAINVKGGEPPESVGTCVCQAGVSTGFTCALAHDDAACRLAGDGGATRLLNGMCKCSNYQRFAPPYCRPYAFTGDAYVASLAPVDDDEAPTEVTPPLFRPAAGGNNVACYGRGQLRVQVGLCSRREPGSALCEKQAGQAHAPYPCRCDPGWDEAVNCLERTEAFELAQRQARCACARAADPNNTCDPGGVASCDLDATNSI